MFFRNKTGQKIRVFAYDATTGLPKTGDAANLTASVRLDYGSWADLADTSAAEEDSTKAKGYYLFDAAQGETDAEIIHIGGRSSTSNIVVIGAPATIFTVPTTGILAPATAGRTLVVDSAGLADSNVVKLGPSGSGTAQTARDVGGAVPAASAGASGGLLINGSNSGTITLAALTCTGTFTISDGLAISRSTAGGVGFSVTGGAGSGSTPGGAAFKVTGGAATTTSGGVAGVGFSAIGGAGAASTNGAGAAVSWSGGGTTTVAGAEGLTIRGTGDANGASIQQAATAGGSVGTGGLVIASGNGTGSGSGLYLTGSGSNHAALYCASFGGGNAILAAAGSGGGDGIRTTSVAGLGVNALNGVTFTTFTPDFAAAGLAQFFLTDSGKVYSDAINGSVVKEIVSNASGGGGGASAADIWNYLTSSITTSGSIGKLIKDDLDATISSRMASYTQPTGFLAANFTTAFGHLDADISSRLATSGYTSPPSSSTIAAEVWDLDATAHQTQGTFGQAIGDPGSDTDSIWALANTNLDAAVSSRSSHAAADVWAVGTRVLTAGTNIVLAKGVGLTGLNDIAATAIVSGGAITTSGGKVSGVILVDTSTALGAAYDASKTAAQAGDAMTLTGDYDLYSADIQYTVDAANTQDEYTVTFYKNGVRQTSGITSPTIQVIKRSDGTDLIAATALTQIGSTGSYKKDATGGSRVTAGEAAIAVVSWTEDSGLRSFSRIVGRDST